MRVALISDIHGNMVSLEAVLADIAQNRVDQIVCLGDVPMFGPQPSQVLARLRDVGCPCVMGNHDMEAVRRAAQDSDMPRADFWIGQWREPK